MYYTFFSLLLNNLRIEFDTLKSLRHFTYKVRHLSTAFHKALKMNDKGQNIFDIVLWFDILQNGFDNVQKVFDNII